MITLQSLGGTVQEYWGQRRRGAGKGWGRRLGCAGRGECWGGGWGGPGRGVGCVSGEERIGVFFALT